MATKSFKSSGTQHNQRGVSQGNTLLDPVTGLPVAVIEDSSGVKRLAVDSTLSIDSASIDVDLDPIGDGVHLGDATTGNTLTVNADGTIDVNVKVDAKDGDSISVSAHVNQIFSQASSTMTVSSFQEIFSFTSSDKNTKIIKVESTASTPTIFQLKINGTIVRMLRSSSLEKNVIFDFSEHISLVNADILTVEAKAERFRLVSYDTFVSLEGYLA